MNLTLHTRPRQRMAAIAASTLCSLLFLSGVEVVMPLWFTQELGFSAAAWAQLRAVRMTGTMIGAVFLGALSDRFGARRLAALNLLATVVIILGMTHGADAGALWLLMACYGATVSTVYLNMNSLTQQVTLRRPGLANTIYRGIGAATGVIAPVLTTFLAARLDGYAQVFTVGAGLLVAAAVLIWFYPEDPPLPFCAWKNEIKELWNGYRWVFRQKALMQYIHVSCLWFAVLAGTSAFAAIYFTQALGRSDQAFGTLASASGLLTVGVVAAGVFFLDRLPLPRIMGALGVLASAASILMGLIAWAPSFAAGFLLFSATTTLALSPFSMWIGQGAGVEAQTAGFAVQKIVGAAYVAVCMAVLGWLEPLIGIRLIFVGTGAIALALSALFFALPAPRAPSAAGS